MELVINYGDPFQRLHENGTSETQPRTFVVGQMTAPVVIEPTEDAGILGIRFRPGGAYPFFSFPQHELVDRIVSLDSLWGNLAQEIEERTAMAVGADEKVMVIEAILASKLCTKSNASLEAAIEEILAADGLISIEEVSEDIGMTRRNLERQFKQFVGLSPKLFARIVRFQRIFKTLESSSIDEWTSLALECGYYDQAHFIREFREFSGRNPSSYFSNEAELSRFFTRGRGTLPD